jgi:hypothetical protein
MSDLRDQLLMELIDKMHGRMADKMFPPDPSHADEPAASGITQDSTTATGIDIPRALPNDAATDVKDGMDVGSHGDTKGTSVGIPEDEPDDEELDELMKHMD